jgi:hypothetical protein
MHTHRHARMHTHTHTNMHPHTHTNMHPHTRTHTHTHTRTHTHTHTRTLMQDWVGECSALRISPPPSWARCVCECVCVCVRACVYMCVCVNATPFVNVDAFLCIVARLHTRLFICFSCLATTVHTRLFFCRDKWPDYTGVCFFVTCGLTTQASVSLL